MKAAITLAVALACSGAAALETPKSAGVDKLIRTVAFHPLDVIYLPVSVGGTLHVVLEAGEEYKFHSFGDSSAFHELEHFGRDLFIKAKAIRKPPIALALVTDKRRYAFKLQIQPARDDGTTLGDMVYRVEIKYPDAEREADIRERAREAIRERLAESRQGVENRNYWKAGSLDIAPVEAWDDGTHTFMRFEGELPAVYYSPSPGVEVLVDTRVQGAASDVLVLHRTARNWVLRLGAEKVLAIENRGYGPGRINETGTTSPGVERRIKGAE